jgi:McbB family protein
MLEKQYVLKDFDLFNDKGEGVLFYSPEISAHIKNKNLIALLREIKHSKIRHAGNSTLNRLIEKYNLQDTTVKKYLSQELKIIAALDEDRFEKIFIHSDDIQIGNALYEYFTDRFGIKMFYNWAEAVVDRQSLIVVFNTSYSNDGFDEAYQLAKRNNAWVITAYIANHYLMIDNIFQPQKGMPCHFCNFNRHQNLVMSKNTLKKTAWANFSRRALAEDVEALPAMRYSEIERGVVLFWLAKAMQNYINPHGFYLSLQDVSRYSWINLISGEVNSEQAVHWPMCQCQDEEH